MSTLEYKCESLNIKVAIVQYNWEPLNVNMSTPEYKCESLNIEMSIVEHKYGSLNINVNLE